MMILRVFLGLSMLGYISCQTSSVADSSDIAGSSDIGSSSATQETTALMDDVTTVYVGGMTNNGGGTGTTTSGAGAVSTDITDSASEMDSVSADSASSSADASVTATTTDSSSSSTSYTCKSCYAKVSEATCGSNTADSTDATTTTCSGGCWFGKFYNSTEEMWYYVRGCLAESNLDQYGLDSTSTSCSGYSDWKCKKGTHLARAKCCTTNNCNIGYSSDITTECSMASTVIVSSLIVYLMLVVVQKLF